MTARPLARVAMLLLVALTFFCLCYTITVKLVLEPRYAFLTNQGVFEELGRLEQQISEREQTIAQLQDRIDLLESALVES